MTEERERGGKFLGWPLTSHLEEEEQEEEEEEQEEGQEEEEEVVAPSSTSVLMGFQHLLLIPGVSEVEEE